MNPLFIIIPIILMDLYVYKGLRGLLKCSKRWFNSLLFWVYWIISLGLLLGILVLMSRYQQDPGDLKLFKHIMSYNGIFLMVFSFKLIFTFFRLISDIRRWIRILLLSSESKRPPASRKSKNISRADFITKLGAILSIVPVLGIVRGIGWGRYNFTLHHKKVKIPGLPKAFDGFKIVQLSDAHLGSLSGQEDRIVDVIEQINELKPDVMVFTGDMVNNFAHEMSGWVPIWKRIKARYGKFSVLGNHDYGGYSTWPTVNAKRRNLQDNIRQQREMGFNVLLNENRKISIDSQSIYIAGVENWGKPPFPQHGNLDKATLDIPEQATTVLLSHDPDHFQHQVIGKTNIQLTLSGHTHGAQFGVEIGKFKLSPVQLKYKRWAGLYQEGKQYLYVNRGLGYLAFPGRVGIWPEITLLELES